MKTGPMPQQPAARASKQTHLRKLLADDSLRQSVDSRWQREQAKTDGLEVLARCKALNEFIRTGLLGAADDDTAPGQHRAAAGKRCAAAGPKRANAPARSTTPAAAAAGSLASRITAKESEALLDLLLADEAAAAEATTPSTEAAATCSANPSTSIPCIVDTQQLPGQQPVPAAAEPSSLQPLGATTSSSDSSSDLLDDVIGLLNAPEVAPDLAVVQQQQPSTSCSSPHQEQQQQQQQQLQGPVAMPSLPAPACRELHRQAWVLPPEQQQEGLRAAAVKHASISAAWQGFYSYWGPHAASTIQHYWRAHKARQQYLQLRAAAVVLQAAVRGHLLRTSGSNLWRLHREERQRQQLEVQRHREQEARAAREQQLLLQEQRLREAQQQQQQQQQQQEQQLQQKREHDAAVTLQCAVRCWAARRWHTALATAAAAAAAAAAQAAQQAARDGPGRGSISSPPSACSRASDSTDNCSRGSSRQSHSRGSTASACSLDAHTAAAPGVMACKGLDELEAGDVQQVEELPAAYLLPGLVIRHAAEKRTASHGGGAGVDCREELARQLVQRAGQLGAMEGMQEAVLATRTLMASSSSRQLQSALQAVRAPRPTM